MSKSSNDFNFQLEWIDVIPPVLSELSNVCVFQEESQILKLLTVFF